MITALTPAAASDCFLPFDPRGRPGLRLTGGSSSALDRVSLAACTAALSVTFRGRPRLGGGSSSALDVSAPLSAGTAAVAVGSSSPLDASASMAA